MAVLLSELEANAALSRNTERGNLNIQFARAATLKQPLASDVWIMGGRRIQFVQLGPNGSLGLDQGDGRIFVKVVTGSLSSPNRRPFCEPRGLQDTTVEAPELVAGPEGALLTIITEPADAPETIGSMDQLRFTGPLAEALQWRTFEEQFSQFTDFFDGADAYIGPGFHLLDENGEEITFVNIWTAGKGVDLSTHNHGQPPSPQMPAFAEIHLTICNGTGKGGMYETDAPGAPDRKRMPVPAGYEHGPFFIFDPDSRAPVMRENGAVDYPWHGWEAGTDDRPTQAYDVVAAFETAPRYAKVSA